MEPSSVCRGQSRRDAPDPDGGCLSDDDPIKTLAVSSASDL